MPVTALADIAEASLRPLSSASIAILPVAATEPHGPHLPVTTDCDIAEGHLAALPQFLADRHDVVILPLQRVGASSEHAAFPGCESRDPADLVAEWFSLVERVAAAGGRRLVVVSSHGGNSAAVDTLILKARVELGILAVGTAWLRFGQPEGMFSDAELRHGIHGGAVETALMLHYAPQKVNRVAAQDFPSALVSLEVEMTHLSGFGRHRFGWMSQDLNPHGVVGDAASTSAEIGARSAAHTLTRFAELVDDVARFDLRFLKDNR